MSQLTTPMLPEMPDVWQQTLNWQPTAEQQCQFQHLYELVLEGNRQFNLTRITEPQEFWEKHLWDSLRGIALLFSLETEKSWLIKSLQDSASVIDIGTGAGFPGIPVAIAAQDWTVTLLDSTQKKITFLNTLLPQLGIQNVTTLTGRAEIVSKNPQHRKTYDIALVRAVGSASVCAEYALPLLKSGGLAILYRGQWTGDEQTALQSALEKLGGTIEAIEGFVTPLSQSIRHCLYLRKVVATTELPRRVSVSTQH